MTNREFFIQRWSAEFPIFLKIFKALPEEKLDYRPHPRSRSAGELLSLLAYEEKSKLEAVRDGVINWTDPPAAAKISQGVDIYTQAHQELEKNLKTVDEKTWETKKVQLKAGGQVAWEATLSEFLWVSLLDMIHHRGQLSTYIRPMGGKVPSIYGPSADDMGG